MSYILHLKEIGQDDLNIVGNKAYSLALMHQYGLPTGNAFIITQKLQQDFFVQNNILARVKKETAIYDLSNPSSVLSASNAISRIILNSQLPIDFCNDLFDEYESLVKNAKQALVTIRTSLIDHEGEIKHPLFLAIKGENTLAETIKELYAKLFSPHLIKQNTFKKIPQTAIIVQPFFNTVSSGYLHTIDPYSNNKFNFVIEAVWGLGEILYHQKVNADKYSINKLSCTKILEKVFPQTTELTLEGNNIIQKDVPSSRQLKAKLSLKQLNKLISYFAIIKKISLTPQSVEWGLYDNDFVFFQSQDTDISQLLLNQKLIPVFKYPIITEGMGNNPGIGQGVLINSEDCYETFLQKIVILDTYNDHILSNLKNAEGIINVNVEKEKELKLFCQAEGIPLINLSKESLNTLKAGTYVTIDGSSGYVYKNTQSNYYERRI